MSKHTAGHAITTTPSVQESATNERRTRVRLRELCDEVIASFRMAQGTDILSAADRAEANRLLAQVTPTMARAV